MNRNHQQYKWNLPQRKSIRLNGYDYSQPGLYFVTIVTQNRNNLFGAIVDNKIILNNAGKMVGKWYYELENKYYDIKCREMVVMPNHFHCIIAIISRDDSDNSVPVGADLRVCPNNPIPGGTISGGTISGGTIPGGTIPGGTIPGGTIPCGTMPGEHTGSPLRRVIQWFKTMTTNEYIRGVKNNNWRPFNGKLWQRNYWEHIIRNKNEYNRIAKYIIDNPVKWENDKLNDGNGNIIMKPLV